MRSNQPLPATSISCMNTRYLPIAAVVASLACAGTAFATDEPPPAAAPAPQASAPATACVDVTRPTTRLLSTSRSAESKHVLRGTAGDKGCDTGYVARVQVSLSLKHGKKCEFLTSKARISSKKSRCSSPHWVNAHGTATWSLRIPKKLQHGTYNVLTRAVDSAGNVERAHARRLAIR
jgi:hypothetical protein